MRRGPAFAGGLLTGLTLCVSLWFFLGATAEKHEPALPDTAVQGQTPEDFTLFAVGDILLSRHVGENISERGWHYPFTGIRALVRGADAAFCNLECPASLLGTPYPEKPEIVTFRANPAALLGLKDAGFDLISLANNHMADYGGAAIGETLDGLDALDLQHAGAGRNREEAHRAAHITVKGNRIALLAYADPIWSVVQAGKNPGVACINPAEMKEDIQREKAANNVVLVSIHWGDEHQGIPRGVDRELARELVDAGASAILGHHPHVLQGAEFYKGVPILYSLGNCVFDMVAETTYQSEAVTLSFTQGKVSALSIRPLAIGRTTYVPAPAEGPSAEAILKLIEERCDVLGTITDRRQDGTLWINGSQPGLPEPHSPESRLDRSSIP